MAENTGAGPLDLPTTVDLLALAAALEARGGKRKLSGALRNAWKAGSCLADLRRSQSCCQTLNRLAATPPASSPNETLEIQSALMTMAVLLYARATSTGGGSRERGSIRLDRGNLTAEQLEDHRTLIRLRNGAFGHVETQETIAGDQWHGEYLFAKRERGGPWGLASGYTSIGFQFEALAILQRQLPVAIAIVARKSREQLDHATEALNETRPSEETLMRHQVDPVAWFGSLHNARLMLSGKPGEELSAWMPLT